MVSTFSPNLQVEEPANGDYSATWGTAIGNTAFTIFDSAFGSVVGIDMSVGNVSMSATQMRSATLILTGVPVADRILTLTNLSTNLAVVSGRFFSVENLCSNSSAFVVVIQSTVAGAEYICVPPNEVVDIVLYGTGSTPTGNVKFRNLGRVGSLMPTMYSSTPRWITSCLKPPYLNCDGTTFSSATYPALANYLSGTTLPDLRGRYAATLDQGQGRITTAGGGVDGATRSAAGGAQATTLSSANIPPMTIQPHNHNIHAPTKYNFTPNADVAQAAYTGTLWSSAGANNLGTTDNSSVITVDSSGPIAFTNLPPTAMAGITLIRAN